MNDRNLYASGRFAGPVAGTADTDLRLVAAIARSSINRIVIARIAEKAGLKAADCTPDHAPALLLERRPGTVIIDGGADNRECDMLEPILRGARELSPRALPILILLTSHNPGFGPTGSILPVDAVVAKPITPENLQPVLLSLVERAEGAA